MPSFPLRAPLGDGITVWAGAPYSTLVVASPGGTLCLSLREQDRLRILMERALRCDELLDPDEDEESRVRCRQAAGRLTLVQRGARVVARGAHTRAALLEVLRASTCGPPAGEPSPPDPLSRSQERGRFPS